MSAGGSKATSLVERARELAVRAHAGQVRKSGGLPYVSHLDAVAELLRQHGHGDEVTLAAALLHDLVEDQPAFADEFRRTMPSDVVDTVLVLSETKLDATGKKKPKSERFDGYIRNLADTSGAALRARPISCADKIHNLSSVVQAEAGGEGLLMRLATRPGEQLDQVARLRPLYEGVASPSLLAAFDAGVDALKRTISAWLPGRAALIMAETHLGQFDRAGKPYVLHPMHLALQAGTLDETMVAFLHDVVEDGDWDLAALAREGFPEPVVRAVDAVTKREGEDYEQFIERIARDRLATRVKLLDLAHNADLSRLPAPTDRDRERAAKYRRAQERLERELSTRNLYVRLDAESRERARAHAVFPVLKADHVTLAHRILPREMRAEWIPGGAGEGGAVEFRAVAVAVDARVQAFVIEMDGSTVRPSDGGTLHLTVSRSADARSRDSNTALASAPRTPIDIPLRGTIEWVDE